MRSLFWGLMPETGTPLLSSQYTSKGQTPCSLGFGGFPRPLSSCLFLDFIAQHITMADMFPAAAQAAASNSVLQALATGVPALERVLGVFHTSSLTPRALHVRAESASLPLSSGMQLAVSFGDLVYGRQQDVLEYKDATWGFVPHEFCSCTRLGSVTPAIFEIVPLIGRSEMLCYPTLQTEVSQRSLHSVTQQPYVVAGKHLRRMWQYQLSEPHCCMVQQDVQNNSSNRAHPAPAVGPLEFPDWKHFKPQHKEACWA